MPFDAPYADQLSESLNTLLFDLSGFLLEALQWAAGNDSIINKASELHARIVGTVFTLRTASDPHELHLLAPPPVWDDSPGSEGPPPLPEPSWDDLLSRADSGFQSNSNRKDGDGHGG